MAKDFRFCLLFELYKGVLTEKQQEAFTNYYYDDLSLAEISENTGISRQGARDAIKRAEEVLLLTEEKLKLAAVHVEMQEAAESIYQKVTQAEDYLKVGNATPVFDLLREIKAESERLKENGI